MCHLCSFQNIPQLIIQIIVLILSINDNTHGENSSNFLITILSMLFTIVSILISVFEYALSKKTSHGEMTRTIGVRFTLHCSEMAKLDPLQFKSHVQFRQYSLLFNIAQLFHLNRHQLERLMPKRVSEGAEFILIIQTDVTNLQFLVHSIENSITRGILAKYIAKTLKFDSKECAISSDKNEFEIVSLDRHRIERARVASSSGISTPLGTSKVVSVASPSSTIFNLGDNVFKLGDHETRDLQMMRLNRATTLPVSRAQGMKLSAHSLDHDDDSYQESPRVKGALDALNLMPTHSARLDIRYDDTVDKEKEKGEKEKALSKQYSSIVIIDEDGNENE